MQPARKNETAEDLRHQNRAKHEIEIARQMTLVDLVAPLYRVDWAMFNRNDDLRGFGEYKFRKQRYDTTILGFRKWMTGVQLSEYSGVPFYLFVEWPEGLHWFKVDNGEEFPIKLGGSSRGQHGDIEPMVHIPSGRFKLLTRKE
jgi:hypothetical protein